MVSLDCIYCEKTHEFKGNSICGDAVSLRTAIIQLSVIRGNAMHASHVGSLDIGLEREDVLWAEKLFCSESCWRSYQADTLSGGRVWW